MPFDWQPGDLVPPDKVASGVPPTPGEEFAAHRDAYDRTRTVDAQWTNQADWLDEKLNDFYQKTGQRLDNPMRLIGIADEYVTPTEKENQAKFAKAGIPYPTQDEIAKGGLDRAISAQQRVADLEGRPTSTMGWLGGLAGDMWATAKDPINIMAMALAPGGGSVAASALRVGAAFAGGTELSNVLTYGYQKQVSPSFTPTEAFIKEPLEAGAQGVAQELGIAGLGAIWRRLVHSGADAREPLPAHDAGTVATKAADLKAQQPFPGEQGASAHEAAIGQMERAINADDAKMAVLPVETRALATPPEPLLHHLTEIASMETHPDERVSAIGGALRDSMEPWGKMQDAVRAGDLPAGADISLHLMDAARAIRQSVEEDRPPMLTIDEGGAFHSDIARLAARAFYQDDEMTKLVSREELASRLRGYVDETMRPTPGLREKAQEDFAGAVRAKTDAATASALAEMTKPENIRNPARALQSIDVAHAELERMRETGNNKHFIEENGEVVPSVIDKEMKRFDDLDAMAKALRDACNTVGEAAE